MEYTFKKVQEVLWAASVGGGLVLLQIGVTFDASTVTDWETWVVAGAGAILRGAAGVALPTALKLFRGE